MTDQTIPAGLTRDQAQAVREWAERSYAAEVQDETMYHAARVLLAVLPKRPTLADMTPAEVGDVIESADDPRLAALPVGSILCDRDDDSVTKRDGAWSGPGFSPIPSEGDEFGPWTVLRIGWGDDQ